MKPSAPQWHESGAVLVCEKCYKTRIPEETPELAERYGDFELQRWLKERCKEAGLGKRVRVIRTGCQDVCEIGLVTVTILPLKNGAGIETFAIDPLADRDAILQQILDRFA
jgi:predicted metal-binding protein